MRIVDLKIDFNFTNLLIDSGGLTDLTDGINDYLFHRDNTEHNKIEVRITPDITAASTDGGRFWIVKFYNNAFRQIKGSRLWETMRAALSKEFFDWIYNPVCM